ncbi:response regulator in two-component regulatory system with PhoR (or CreC), regulation of Pi uptake (OmpR family) [Nitrolancea hollandica Lb]|uniref:Response regulator in two-component regulatory system with PhoR (Or CreC), regulation of Pi uptake (OmpR family) n=1 Tax=Nitrolancea hollandica Lb TaxID=1129897 RepID=I4ED72_9BACT|nr:response regulator in two-component regulatory system with PhoR (or CreC), regulation of Pi uptake (OmpR family) [Nitrolancea hollandica Lb]
MVVQQDPIGSVWNSVGREALSHNRRVLIAEDDETLAATLRYTLQKHGYQVTIAHDGREALKSARTVQPDLVVLDLMLPLISGHDVCRYLRKWTDVPILMLTALGDEDDIIAGLEAGADDYVTKPFSMRALQARIKALLRRTQSVQQDGDVLSANGVTLFLKEHRAFFHQRELRLPPKEFKLLEVLMRRAGKVCSRMELLDLVWGEEVVIDPRNIDVHIRWLRGQLEGESDGSQLIETVHGIGYRFVGDLEPGFLEHL